MALSPPSRIPLLLASATLFAGCSGETTAIIDSIDIYTVGREDMPINVKEGGELEAVKVTVVRSLVEGDTTILSLVPEGTLVKPGDKLVELDVADLVDKRASQEILVEQARNAFEQATTAQDILEKELQTKKNTADSQFKIAAMELEKLLGARDGKGSEGRNADMVKRLRDLVRPAVKPEIVKPGTEVAEASATKVGGNLIEPVDPQKYAGLVDKVTALLRIRGEEGDPLERDMGEMANRILQQTDQIRLAMAQLKVAEETAMHSRSLAKKNFITKNELERHELDYQSQASKVAIAWNDLEILINYTLEKDKIEMRQNLENAELEVERVTASNDAERKNSRFDVDAKQSEYNVAKERLDNLEKQISNAIIFSPGSGLVVYSRVSRGHDSESIEEGSRVRERQAIILLPDNSRLSCKVQVQEAMIEKIRVGMPVQISAEARPNKILTGRVTSVAPVADSASRYGGNDKKVYTTNVLLDGINDDETLKAGMKASATITIGTIPNVLTVPIQSVQSDRRVNYVWKKTPQGPVAVAIKIGAHNQEKVEVTEGISEGDLIYRTPPGVADPTFEQPAMPEPDPMSPQANADDNGGSDRENRRPGGERGGRGGFTRKKYPEMNAEELAEAKGSLLQMSDRFGSFLDEDKQAELTKLIRDVIQAIDDNELEKAQRLRDAGMRKLMPQRGGRGGERRRNGG